MNRVCKHMLNADATCSLGVDDPCEGGDCPAFERPTQAEFTEFLMIMTPKYLDPFIKWLRQTFGVIVNVVVDYDITDPNNALEFADPNNVGQNKERIDIPKRLKCTGCGEPVKENQNICFNCGLMR